MWKEELKGWKKWEIAWLLICCAVIMALSVYWKDSVIGIISATTGVACVVCTGKGKLSAYIFGVVNILLYALISFEAKYYGKSAYTVGSYSDVIQKLASEDCLYLNIWLNADDKTEKKPVMVWIHGGAYAVGSGSQFGYNGANLVQAQSDIILVNINYRLNMYGFMDFSSVPGGEAFESASCNGLLDQAMALRWVHENIAAFGGDPDNVTIFGQSAGDETVSGAVGPAALPPVVEKEGEAVFQRGCQAFVHLVRGRAPQGGDAEQDVVVGDEFVTVVGPVTRVGIVKSEVYDGLIGSKSNGIAIGFQTFHLIIQFKHHIFFFFQKKFCDCLSYSSSCTCNKYIHKKPLIGLYHNKRLI